MDYITSIAITIGVLAGLWGYVGLTYGLLVWAGFISWASYYAAGGKVEGLKKALASNLSGVIWAFLMFKGAGLLGLSLPVALGITIAVGAFFIVLQAKISLLSFIPGAFAGAGAYFGGNCNWQGVAIALVCGAVLGYISDITGTAIMKKDKK